MKYCFALLLYRLILLILLPVIYLFFLIRSRKNPAYRFRFLERLGFINKNMKQGGMVIHAASVGEVLALKTLVEQLLQRHPEQLITFTTFTPTGSEQVIKLFGDRVQHCYLPLDIYFSTALFLHKLKPNAIIYMETELWPNLVAHAKRRGIKQVLVNGRISDKTVSTYMRFSALFTPCLQNFDAILSQSSENQQRFIKLGAAELSCHLSGNIKYDMQLTDEVRAKQQTLQTLLPQQKKYWVMASTHDGDEALALASFKTLQAKHKDLLLILVPRHPERFSLVTELANKAGFITQNRSSNTPVSDTTNVWILDSLGELMPLYGLADIVTIGGSFSHIEGHNPLEPAYFSKPIITGPKMANFADIMQQLTLNSAISQLSNSSSDELSAAVEHLLMCDLVAKQQGDKAKQVVMNNQGAVDKTLTAIELQLS